MGGVMLCDRERDKHRSQKFYATIHSEKMTHLTIVIFCKRQFPAAVCFRDEQLSIPSFYQPYQEV
jgi:hypothetical protein